MKTTPMRGISRLVNGCIAGSEPSPELNQRNQFSPMPAPLEILRRVRAEAERFRGEVEALLQMCKRAMPDWWISGWRNAFYLADCFGAKVAALDGWPRIATEWRLDSPHTIQLGERDQLHLRGRIDLILARDAGDETELWVVDYKTGNRKSLRPSRCETDEEFDEKFGKKLRCGDGIQLALYALALREKAKSIGISLLSRSLALDQPQLGLREIGAQKDFWGALARMQLTGIFGMRGAIRSPWNFTGAYPLATLGIDPDLLEDKWTLTHPALAVEVEDPEE